MDGINVFILCLVLVTHRVWSSELSPPHNLKIISSMFKFFGNDSNVIYTVQYDKSPGTWETVCYCKEPFFNLSSAARDFYGKRLRVRAERENQTSAWEMSEQVQCAHIDTCSPQITLKVEPDRVLLWMTNRDKSLLHEHGAHIIFQPMFWKTSKPDDIQVHGFSTNPLVLSSLEVGQEYCFQVKYLVFHKSYGRPSQKLCALIPETAGQRTLRIILAGLLTVGVLAGLGCGLFYIYLHYKKIKNMLRPPQDIPLHFKEFLFTDSYKLSIPSPLVSVEESFDLITVVGQEDGCWNAEDTSASST